jgi:transposase
MDYLASTTIKEFEELYRNEKNADVKHRLLMCMHRKEGRSYKKISEMLKTPKTAIYNWVQRFTGGSIIGLHRKPGSGGYNRHLTKIQEKQLQDKLKKEPMTSKGVLVYIKQEFNERYHPNSIPRLMRRLGYSLITPRKRHYKANPRSGWAFKGHIKKVERMEG